MVGLSLCLSVLEQRGFWGDQRGLKEIEALSLEGKEEHPKDDCIQCMSGLECRLRSPTVCFAFLSFSSHDYSPRSLLLWFSFLAEDMKAQRG